MDTGNKLYAGLAVAAAYSKTAQVRRYPTSIGGPAVPPPPPPLNIHLRRVSGSGKCLSRIDRGLQCTFTNVQCGIFLRDTHKVSTGYKCTFLLRTAFHHPGP